MKKPDDNKRLYLEDVTVSFDGFKALNELSLLRRSRGVALHHRAERRRENHHDGCHYRQDATRFRNSLLRQHTSILLKLSEAEIVAAGIGRKFQKPTVFEQLTVFENLELALAGKRSFLGDVAGAHLRCCSRSESTQVLQHHRSDRARELAGANSRSRPEAMARNRHAADAGSRTASGR